MRLVIIRTVTCTAAAFLAVGLLGPPRASASEGGASFYLLGSGGPGAAILPPLPGLFFDNTAFHYHGQAKANRQFVIGGNVVAGADATIAADFATIVWVPSTKVAGGTLALGAALAVGQPNVEVDAIITGPRGGQVTITRKDKAFMMADPVMTAELGWNIASNTHLATGATVNIPIGHYREGELANLSFHRWIVDLSSAITWLDPKAGWDVTSKAGFTFNGKNDFTDYKTGTEFHIEASVERKFSKQFSAGVQAYHFQQVSGDSGAGATLGPFKGRVSAVGLTVAYNFELGKTPVALRTRLFKEFGEKNRLGNGTSLMLDLAMPLHVQMPAKPEAKP